MRAHDLKEHKPDPEHEQSSLFLLLSSLDLNQLRARSRANINFNYLDAKSLSFSYSEYLCAARGAHPLYRWSTILQSNGIRVFYLYLLPALHTISCCHYALLRLVYYLYSYYENKTLSIGFGLIALFFCSTPTQHDIINVNQLCTEGQRLAKSRKFVAW